MDFVVVKVNGRDVIGPASSNSDAAMEALLKATDRPVVIEVVRRLPGPPSHPPPIDRPPPVARRLPMATATTQTSDDELVELWPVDDDEEQVADTPGVDVDNRKYQLDFVPYRLNARRRSWCSAGGNYSLLVNESDVDELSDAFVSDVDENSTNSSLLMEYEDESQQREAIYVNQSFVGLQRRESDSLPSDYVQPVADGDGRTDKLNASKNSSSSGCSMTPPASDCRTPSRGRAPCRRNPSAGADLPQRRFSRCGDDDAVRELQSDATTGRSTVEKEILELDRQLERIRMHCEDIVQRASARSSTDGGGVAATPTASAAAERRSLPPMTTTSTPPTPTAPSTPAATARVAVPRMGTRRVEPPSTVAFRPIDVAAAATVTARQILSPKDVDAAEPIWIRHGDQPPVAAVPATGSKVTDVGPVYAVPDKSRSSTSNSDGARARREGARCVSSDRRRLSTDGEKRASSAQRAADGPKAIGVGTGSGRTVISRITRASQTDAVNDVDDVVDAAATAAATRSRTETLRELYSRYVDVMYTNPANLEHTIAVQQALFSQQFRLPQPNSATPPPPTADRQSPNRRSVACGGSGGDDEMRQRPASEWVVRRRSDGSRYIARRTVAQPPPAAARPPPEPARRTSASRQAAEERRRRTVAAVAATTDDDAASSIHVGRYWTREERRQQAKSARERQQRRRQRVEEVAAAAAAARGRKDDTCPELVAICRSKSLRCHNDSLLDGFTTLNELLAHGQRETPKPNAKTYNRLLSVTTV